MPEFTDALKRRIQSMANTHALLSRTRWQGASLAELVDGELAPWATDRSLTLEGPQVFLAAEATQATAMVLHELATNAAKYGALCAEAGHVSVRWHCASNSRASTALFLEWQETGGPSVVVPTRSGYGTSVICDLIPYELGGAVDLTFAPTGVGCRIVVPAKWIGYKGVRAARRGLASRYFEMMGEAMDVQAETLS
jgi:two-component sensor histidine kinase